MYRKRVNFSHTRATKLPVLILENKVVLSHLVRYTHASDLYILFFSIEYKIDMERRKPSTANKSQTEKVNMNPKDPMTKIQKQVTAWLKDNVPTKRTKFLYSHVVDYFSGKKAVDMLMEESPWAPPATILKPEDNSMSFMFESREHCVEFLDMLLRYKMFHRAKKVPVTEENKGKRGKKKDSRDSDDGYVEEVVKSIFFIKLISK